MANVLVIDDEVLITELLARKIDSMSHEVTCAFTLQDGLVKAADGNFDVVYLDVRLPDGNGLEEIEKIRSVGSKPEVIIMTGYGDPDGAELAIKNGAWDYITKPSSISNMILPLERALQYRERLSHRRNPVALKRHGIVGSGPKMQVLFDQIAQAASSDAGVLIQGETGSGKELVAWAIHNNSTRADRSFVVVDCASLTETLVESVLFGHARGAYTGAHSAHDGLISQADGGTLFLDEIGELPASIQKSFLRVLQGHLFRPLGASQELRSDFRLIAATNRDLEEMAKSGMFRSDLLYRISAFLIDVPPMRECPEDIRELVFYYMAKTCERHHTNTKSISPELLEILVTYPWPGNVRELVNAVDRMVATAGTESTLIPIHLPENIRISAMRGMVKSRSSTDAHANSPEKQEGTCPVWNEFRKEALFAAEGEYIQKLLLSSGGDFNTAIASSGLSRSRLYELLKKHQITFPQRSSPPANKN